jgi:hypothetical protein
MLWNGTSQTGVIEVRAVATVVIIVVARHRKCLGLEATPRGLVDGLEVRYLAIVVLSVAGNQYPVGTV